MSLAATRCAPGGCCCSTNTPATPAPARSSSSTRHQRNGGGGRGVRDVSAHTASPNTVQHQSLVTAQDRVYWGTTVWLTGLSGAGESSVAMLVERKLLRKGHCRLRSRQQPAARARRRPRLLDGRPGRGHLRAGARRDTTRGLGPNRAGAGDQSAGRAPRPGSSPRRRGIWLCRSILLSTPRSWSARSATRRGCTQKHARVRSRASPASTALSTAEESGSAASTSRRNSSSTWCSRDTKRKRARAGSGGGIRSMRMSAKAEYAVRAMVQLATAPRGTLVKTDDLAQARASRPSFLSTS